MFVFSPTLLPPAFSRIDPEVSKMKRTWGRSDCAPACPDERARSDKLMPTATASRALASMSLRVFMVFRRRSASADRHETVGGIGRGPGGGGGDAVRLTARGACGTRWPASPIDP